MTAQPPGPTRRVLSETPESQRYLNILNGGSRTAARLGHRATNTKDTAGRLLGRMKEKRAEAKQAADDRKAIQSGDTKNIE